MPFAPINPAGLAFDIDGVIADTMTLFLRIAREDFDIQGLSYQDITCYNLEDCIGMERATIDRIVTRILDGDYEVPLMPLRGAPEVLTRLVHTAGPVLCVTARPSADPIQAWIRNLLPVAAAGLNVVATGSFDAKGEILKQWKKTHFVEDRLETCFQLDAAGIAPILFVQPWNREPHPFREVSSWEEISDLIQW